jgi:curved DNA-binding protein CbpA
MNKQKLQEKLSHYSYHWFWGMRYSSNVEGSNLRSKVFKLVENPVLLQNLEAQHKKIAVLHPILRFFNRFFNIDNYNAHFYQLYAFYAYKHGSTTSEENMIKKNEMINLTVQLLSSFRARCTSYFSKVWNYLDYEISNANQLENKQVTKSCSLDNIVHVTLPMIQYLKDLSIEAHENQLIPFQEIRKAYRNKIFATHPDKNEGNNGLDFQIVHISYKQLEHLIKGEKVEPELTQELKNIKREKLHKVINNLDTYSDNLNRETEEVLRSCSELDHKGDQQDLRLDEMEFQLNAILNAQTKNVPNEAIREIKKIDKNREKQSPQNLQQTSPERSYQDARNSQSDLQASSFFSSSGDENASKSANSNQNSVLH